MLLPLFLAIALARPPGGAEPSALDAAGVLAQFPLRKGARWTFEGEVAWSTGRSGGARARRVRTVMDVLQFIPGDEGFAAVVRGFPMDLAWYGPGYRPRLSILVCKRGRLHRVDSPGLRAAGIRARGLLADRDFPARDEDPFLELPLEEGKVWGSAQGRTDTLYRWVVEGRETRVLAGKGLPRAAVPVFTASFRTLPDRMAYDFTPGLGLTAFAYAHNGAVARANVHLVAFKPGE